MPSRCGRKVAYAEILFSEIKVIGDILHFRWNFIIFVVIFTVGFNSFVSESDSFSCFVLLANDTVEVY